MVSALRVSPRRKEALHAGGYCFRVGKILAIPPGETCAECGLTVSPSAVAAEVVRREDGDWGVKFPSRNPYTGEVLDWGDDEEA